MAKSKKAESEMGTVEISDGPSAAERVDVLSDAELVSKIDLNESELADILGKTRQAVNYTLQKSGSEHGLRYHELSQLHSYFVVRDRLKSRMIRDHIEVTRPAGTLSRVLSKNGLFLTGKELSTARSVMFVIPDYRYFRVNHPGHCRAFLKRARKAPKSVLFVATLEDDGELFWRDALKDEAEDWKESLPHMITSVAGAYPYVAFLEPDIEARTHESCWVQGVGGFQRGDELRADSMFRFLFEKASPSNFEPGSLPRGVYRQG